MTKGLKRALALLQALALSPAALALGPHEILVLANGNSRDSIEVGKEFCKLRSVPDINVVRLNVPVPAAGQPSEISPGDFTRLIWSPASRAAQERRIEDHVLAWVYSTDFPLTIKTAPEISIQGITFLRNKLPDPESVRQGAARSPLFAGPERSGGGSFLPQTLDSLREWLGPEMPLPSMMLGVLGPLANKKEAVIRCLRRGKASDGTAPRGTIYFARSDDIRSRCREWQFPSARQELLGMGIRCEITDAFPAGRADVMGLMMGTATLPATLGDGYLPGCMADHLTSAAAIFHSADQSKLTLWIEAGATASSGAVTEPFSVWEKFPSARFYAQYASGCCMIESFFQSTRCPLQIIFVGDPLAEPWGPKAELAVQSVERAKESEPLKIGVRISADAAACYGKLAFLIDGRLAAEKLGVISGHSGDVVTGEVAAGPLTPGTHALRAVAYRTGFLRNQVFGEREFEVGADGKAGVKP